MFENCSHSSGRAFPAAAVAAALLFVLASSLFALRANGFSLRGTEGRCAYLASLGLQADPSSELLRTVFLPARFDALLEDYNDLQLAQGFDLRAAAGRSCLSRRPSTASCGRCAEEAFSSCNPVQKRLGHFYENNENLPLR